MHCHHKYPSDGIKKNTERKLWPRQQKLEATFTAAATSSKIEMAPSNKLMRYRAKKSGGLLGRKEDPDRPSAVMERFQFKTQAHHTVWRISEGKEDSLHLLTAVLELFQFKNQAHHMVHRISEGKEDYPDLPTPVLEHFHLILNFAVDFADLAVIHRQ